MIIEAKSRARVGRRPQPPPPPRRHYKIIGYIGGLFATYSSYMGASLLRFSHFWGHFHHGGPFYYFLLHGGGLFWACPPPTKISTSAHDCKEGARACSPEIFLCNRSFVSSGHVLLRFCLKNDKNNDKLNSCTC